MTIIRLNSFLGVFAESSFEATTCGGKVTRRDFSAGIFDDLVPDLVPAAIPAGIPPEQRLLGTIKDGRSSDLESDALMQFTQGKLTQEQLISFSPKAKFLPEDGGRGDPPTGAPGNPPAGGPRQTPGPGGSKLPATGSDAGLGDPTKLPPDELIPASFDGGCWHYSATRVYFSGIGGVQASGQAAKFSIGAKIKGRPTVGIATTVDAKLTYSLTGDLLRRRVPDGRGGFQETDPLLTGRFTCSGTASASTTGSRARQF